MASERMDIVRGKPYRWLIRDVPAGHQWWVTEREIERATTSHIDVIEAAACPECGARWGWYVRVEYEGDIAAAWT